MTLRLSNSEMAVFRRCKRKWYLSYYRRLVPKARSPYMSPISIGNLVHDALAAFYDPEQRTHPVKYVTDRLQAELDENMGYEPEIRKQWDLADAMLSGYVDWLEETGADSNLRFLGSERFVEVPVSEEKSGVTGGFTILSKLDAPVEQISDGAKLALEHKTVQSLVQPLELLRIDTQLLTEHLVRFLDAIEKGAETQEAYDQCHGILYNMLRKVKRTAAAKPPFYGREVAPHNVHELRNHWRHVVSIAKEIEEAHTRLDAGEDHHDVVPPSPDRSCSWQCQFFKVCPMFDDNTRVEDAVDAMFEVGDPLARYDGSEPLDD